MKRPALWTLWFTLLIPLPSFGQIFGQSQQQGGAGRSVSGSISFMGGTPVAARITVESSNRAINRTLFSDGSGGFSISGLPAGEYYITIDAPGYREHRERIEVPPGNGILTFQFILRASATQPDSKPGDPISLASLKVPADARREFEAGLADWKQNNLKKARERFEAALSKHADFPEALWALAQLDIAEGQIPKAVERLRQAVKLAPTFYEGHLSLSKVLSEDGQAADSFASAESAIQARPDRWEGHYQKGLAALSLNRLELVDQCVSKIEELGQGKVPDTRLLRAGKLLKTNHNPEARVELEAFLAAAPGHPNAALARRVLAQLPPG